MRSSDLPNLALIAVTSSYFVQVGAGFFALAVIGRVLTAAPPRSLAMLTGPYGYDSGPFWETVPPITALLFLLALVANWKSRRRALILGALVIFVLSGVASTVVLPPLLAEFTAGGYHDAVDPELQRRAAIWYASDWGIRCVDAVAGVMLLVALTRSTPERAAA